MALLGIDIGTTHCKAGLFAADGSALKIASKPTITRRTSSGEAYIDPQELWQTVASVIREATVDQEPVSSIGIASMAETGLFMDRLSSKPRSNFIPWFETTAQPYADLMQQQSDPRERFLKTGLRATFKCSLAKILWLRDRNSSLLQDAIWLSAADYIAYRLSGKFCTDYSLAGFSYAFRMDRREWDEEWLNQWGLQPNLFPPVSASGTPAGGLQKDAAIYLGLPGGIPVTISGHDHAVAAFAMGVIEQGKVFNSMGTAETLFGVLNRRSLTDDDYDSGLVFGCHVVEGLNFWLGSLSASGGSLEWLRNQLAGYPLSYTEIDALLAEAQQEPTGILYFPYLLGSGAPHVDPQARAAFVGLSASHTRSDLLKAVLEGTAFEIEYIRRAGERITGQPITSLLTAGGGTRNPAWLQIKADVSGCRTEASTEPEASLLGAALISGIGCGFFKSAGSALDGLATQEVDIYMPDPDRHAIYQQLFEQGYLKLQEPLRAYFHSIREQAAIYD